MSAITTTAGPGARSPRPHDDQRAGAETSDGGRMTGIGLAIPADSTDDHFVAALVNALAEPLIAEGYGLFTRVVHDVASERRMYRLWAASDGIAGVVLLGAGRGDDRVRLLRSLGVPFAAVADVSQQGEFPAVLVDAAASVDVISGFLAAGRHERTVYLAAPGDSVTSKARANAVGDRFEIVQVERDAAAAVAAASAIVATGPATLLFDSDVHAAAAASAFIARGLAVPDDVAIVSWTDSALCRSATPSLTAVDRRGGEIGRLLGHRMLATITGGEVRADRAPDPFIVRRESA
ncbi:substrate-binding domain-containing protein [Microbacterium sp. NPDC058389]|uniref:substrate-binding domain-containing protein n=1 Tax=Microbacterium sp. NPDC058389 TaxID=3346475 RepID=UPI00365D1DCE